MVAQRRAWRRKAVAAAAVLGLASFGQAQQSGVAATPHNLSASGPGDIRAVSETQICLFCHIPHGAEPAQPLWGRALPSAPLYGVPKLRTATPGLSHPAPQPDGSSRLCLSCHDGTVALGEIAGESRSIPMAGAQRLAPGRTSYLGTDLSGGHPVSFVVPDADPAGAAGDEDMGLRPRDLLQSDPDVRLDERGRMQCTTCHDPHSDRNYQPERTPHFWVKPTIAEVCLVCHQPR